MVITLQTCCCGPCFGTILSGGKFSTSTIISIAMPIRKLADRGPWAPLPWPLLDPWIPSSPISYGPLLSSCPLGSCSLSLSLHELFFFFFFKSDVKQINISFILMESSFVPSLPLQCIPLFSPLSTTYIKEQFICSVFTFIPTQLISTTTFYPTSALMPMCRLVSHHQ